MKLGRDIGTGTGHVDQWEKTVDLMGSGESALDYVTRGRGSPKIRSGPLFVGVPERSEMEFLQPRGGSTVLDAKAQTRRGSPKSQGAKKHK